MIIDSHEHVILPAESQLEKLKRASVDKAVLFYTTPHPEKAKNYGEWKEEMAKLFRILSGESTEKSNSERIHRGTQELLRSIRAFPEHFTGFGGVPLGLGLTETGSWIEEEILGNGLRGIGEYTPGSEEQIRQLETVFQALQDLPELPVWVHCFHPVTSFGLKILIELHRKYPSVPLIFGHSGGWNWQMLLEYAKSAKKAYIDTSASFSSLVLKMLLSELPERCLFSSDAPYGEPLLCRQGIEFASPEKWIAERVLGENIRELLSL